MKGLTDTRSPIDHFVSGALISGIATGAKEMNTMNQNGFRDFTKNIIKNAARGGVMSYCAINASNNLASKNIAKASLNLGLGLLFGMIVKDEKTSIVNFKSGMALGIAVAYLIKNKKMQKKIINKIIKIKNKIILESAELKEKYEDAKILYKNKI